MIVRREKVSLAFTALSLFVVLVTVLASVITLLNLSHEENSSSERTKRSNSSFKFRNKVHKVSWSLARNANLIQPSAFKNPVEDIFISVKTTQKFHESRLDLILRTWYNAAKNNVWFFTDGEGDSGVPERLSQNPDRLVRTGCPTGHSRSDLCCKMAAEIKAFLETSNDKRWFCHFDDDNYVNVPALARTLRRFDSNEDWYLGKASVQQPLEVFDHRSADPKKKISFWFATGGAGFCLSRPLAEKMRGLVTTEGFVDVGERIRLPDDVTLGFVAEHLLGVPLTRVDEFHSHLEALKLIPSDSFENQISFSYSTFSDKTRNVVQFDKNLRFEEEEELDPRDQSRFLQLHCKLFPSSIQECKYFA